MNEPSHSAPAPMTQVAPSANEEPPRGWWLSLWRKAIHLISPPPDATVLREVVEELIDEPLSESGISPAERLLLANIIKLRERRASDCMVPRSDIVAMEVTQPIKDMLHVMDKNGYSRIPVYRGTLDDVVGMVHVKDIVPMLANNRPCAIADLLRPVMYVAPSMPASRLLLQMRQTRQHMAMVIDEFGGIDGLVTIEDLVEEIVGEIEDEHDAPSTPPIIARADGTLLTDARLTIEAFEYQTGLRLPPLDGEDIDTLGGYVAHLAGQIPRVGEHFVNKGGIGFEVLEMDQSRISRLRVRVPTSTSEIKIPENRRSRA